MSGRALTSKQEAFVCAYLSNGRDASAAYREAYNAKNSSPKTINEQACLLLKHPKISARVAEVVAKVEARTEITVERIIRELALIGFANMADYMKSSANGDPYLDFSSLTRDQAAALVEVTVDDFVDGRGDDARDVKRVKFKLADKKGALVDLGKHLGMFVERHDHKVVVTLEQLVLDSMKGKPE